MDKATLERMQAEKKRKAQEAQDRIVAALPPAAVPPMDPRAYPQEAEGIGARRESGHTGTRRRGDRGTRGHGDMGTHPHRDISPRGRGDKGTLRKDTDMKAAAYLPREWVKALKREALDAGITLSELLRRIVEAYLKGAK